MAAPYDHSKQNAHQVAEDSQQFARGGVSGTTTVPLGYSPLAKPGRSPFRGAVFSVPSGAADRPAAQVDANGNVTKSGGPDVGALTTGQCSHEPAAQSRVSVVETVPCGQPHDAPMASDSCQMPPDGPDVDQSKLGGDASVIDFAPIADSWANLDRKVTCAVGNGTGTKLTESVAK